MYCVEKLHENRQKIIVRSASNDVCTYTHIVVVVVVVVVVNVT
jgi:hypothetical protein